MLLFGCVVRSLRPTVMSFSKACMMVLPRYRFHRQRSRRQSQRQQPLNARTNEVKRSPKNSQKWLAKNEKPKKKKLRTLVPITIVPLLCRYELQ